MEINLLWINARVFFYNLCSVYMTPRSCIGSAALSSTFVGRQRWRGPTGDPVAFDHAKDRALGQAEFVVVQLARENIHRRRANERQILVDPCDFFDVREPGLLDVQRNVGHVAGNFVTELRQGKKLSGPKPNHGVGADFFHPGFYFAQFIPGGDEEWFNAGAAGSILRGQIAAQPTVVHTAVFVPVKQQRNPLITETR